jgi:hypothetical protein
MTPDMHDVVTRKRPRVILSVAVPLDGYIDHATPERLLLSSRGGLRACRLPARAVRRLPDRRKHRAQRHPPVRRFRGTPYASRHAGTASPSFEGRAQR